MKRFRLLRTEDVSGLSGTGHVADGVEFDDGCVVLRWCSKWPTSVVFHDRGIESVKVLHGHEGRTVIEWIDTVHDPQGTQVALFDWSELDR